MNFLNLNVCARLGAIEEQLEQIVQHLDTLTQSVSAAQADAATTQLRVTEINGDLLALRDTVNVLSDEADTLQTTLSAVDNRLSDAELDVAQLEANPQVMFGTVDDFLALPDQHVPENHFFVVCDRTDKITDMMTNLPPNSKDPSIVSMTFIAGFDDTRIDMGDDNT